MFLIEEEFCSLFLRLVSDVAELVLDVGYHGLEAVYSGWHCEAISLCVVMKVLVWQLFNHPVFHLC